MAQSSNRYRLGNTLRDIMARKSVGRKKPISLYRLAKDSTLDYGYVYRIVHGQANPSRETLKKLCSALQCSQEESIEIFHAADADFLAPEESEEEQSTAQPAA